MQGPRGETTAFQRNIGTHLLSVDEENILTVILSGNLRGEDMREILLEHDTKLVREGDLYVLSDLRTLRSVEPRARHVLGQRPKTLPGYCVAYMVSSFKLKLLLELLLKAVNLGLSGKVLYRFFEVEAQGREWLRQMQQQRGRR